MSGLLLSVHIRGSLKLWNKLYLKFKIKMLLKLNVNFNF